MTPRMRKGKQDANSKVYYSKKVPQQVYFPHKRRTVRRPLEAVKDGSDKRQLRFLPEKMKIRRVNTVKDSDEEDEEDLEEGGVAISVKEEAEEGQTGGESANSRGKKRHSNVMETNDENEVETSNPTPKRRRKVAAPRSSRHSKQVKIEPEEEYTATPRSSVRRLTKGRTLRRQSTMTQLVEGRRPMSDTEEPQFKPVKRKSRQSSKAMDKNQRTLTQMVPGMKPLELASDDDLDEEYSDAEAAERENQAYGDAVAIGLVRPGLNKSKSKSGSSEEARNDDPSGAHSQRSERREAGAEFGVPALVVQFFEGQASDEEESYQPTQFIDAPSTRTKPSPKRASGIQGPQATEAHTNLGQSKRKSRFSLLSTPEKRRVRMIPSSQSPPDTPLSAQISPTKAHRSPLMERSGNDTPVIETPSKRKVAFQESDQEPFPPPSLKKFRSVIQDSEDEEDEELEIDGHNDDDVVGEHTQAMIHDMDNATLYKDVGADTQAILERIDQVCAAADEDRDMTWHNRETSEELDTSNSGQVQNESSPELRVKFQQETIDGEEEVSQEQSPYLRAHVGIKTEQSYDSHLPLCFDQESAPGEIDPVLRAHEPVSDSSEFVTVPEHIPSSPPIIQQPVEDTCPSTPMVIMDSSDEEEPIPPQQDTHITPKPSTTALKYPADLNGELVQVPQSPPTQHETQQSHSSKAEQQLHEEWSSYSQYISARPPQSSSMKVAHDKFSYHATPKPPHPAMQTQPSGHYTSQATTIDEVTPRKNRTQRINSNNTTPHKIASSQPVISPSKPPPIFIPSSFPSPTKARLEEWSSSVYGNTQMTFGVGGSLEDFSIPLPPPPDEEDWA
ncbi:hypothetical protein BDU57DRAFT_524810 [Ampelomyces quisqualis]|uniref:Uncharacterized protein n=1 Tax=Ampelomyces quisqualis TaxID=50730 RepID=A0A6A5Q9T6_AMPQU|nr:hypothetical protein BDU57DRAFT_524810 [Ampelomyces quisqualis]